MCGFWYGFLEILDMILNRGKSYILDEFGIILRVVWGLFRCWGGWMVVCFFSFLIVK